MLLISSRTTLSRSSRIGVSTGFSIVICTVSVKLFVTVLKSFTVVNLVFTLVVDFVVYLVDIDMEIAFVDLLTLSDVSPFFGRIASLTPFQILNPPPAAVVDTDSAIEELEAVFTLNEVLAVVAVVVVVVVRASCFAKNPRTLNGNSTRLYKYGRRSIANPMARG
jgi:hypothetical protein